MNTLFPLSKEVLQRDLIFPISACPKIPRSRILHSSPVRNAEALGSSARILSQRLLQAGGCGAFGGGLAAQRLLFGKAAGIRPYGSGQGLGERQRLEGEECAQASYLTFSVKERRLTAGKESGRLLIGGGEKAMAAAFATMTSKGQVTIPKEVREELHMKPHDKILVTTEGNRAALRPLHGTILGLKGILHRKGMKPIDFKKLRHEAEKGMAMDALKRAGIRPPKAR